jgi:alkanesulfonate monooxygenase SsuD/methylene tetrahydromethanopterin reductase-like flavin-dependent oxidoreductase (luciferase family)
MQLGWLTLALSPSPDQDKQRIEELLEQACYVEQAGFSDIWLTEHYFTGESVYNDPIVFATALAMRTSTVRIGFAVLQLTLHHPVRLAVQLALLDNLSGGRIDVGLGRGTVYNEYEFVGFGLRSDDSRERMAEAQAILERCWTDTPFTHQGRYFNCEVPEMRPQPYQKPHPPIWRSVISESSFVECAEQGRPFLTARLSLERIAERWALYRSSLEEAGHDSATIERCLREAAVWRNVYVAESDAQAEDELNELLRHTRTHMNEVRERYNPRDFVVDPNMLNPWTDPAIPDDEAIAYVLGTGSIFGGPKRVTEELHALEQAGVGHVLCQTGFGDMAHEQTMRSLRLFGEHVIPALSDGTPGNSASAA